MLKSYIIVAWRSFFKDSFYSFLNVIGIAIAIAAFILIINYVRYEHSYENFHQKADNVYRVTLDLYEGKQYVVTDCETHPPLAPLLKTEIPEVVDYVRIQRVEELPEVSHDGKFYKVDRLYAADPSLFNVFSYKLIEGDPSTALSLPMQAVVTETLARRLFGTTDIKGKVLKSGERMFSISGVMEDPPLNTHLKLDMVLSFISLEKMGWDLNNWHGNNNYTYLLLRPGINLAAFNSKLKSVTRGKIKNRQYVAEPVKDIHLRSHKTFEPEVNGNIKTVNFLMITAILILLIGSVNYVNVTTARAAERFKEVGVRKVLGSSRMLLVKQFMTETLLTNIFAFTISALLIRLTFPAYLILVDRPADTTFFASKAFFLIYVGLFLFNCLLSGIYPALALSATKPASVINRTSTSLGKSDLFRKVLVTGQFTIALVVLTASFIVFRQLSYMRHQDLGVNASQILTIRAPNNHENDSVGRYQSQTFKNSLMQLPGVEKVAISGALPGLSLHELSTMTSITRYGSDAGKGYNYYLYGIDADFIPAMTIEMAAGSNFRQGLPNKDEVIITEEASRLMGFKSAKEAVGEKISLTLSADAKFSTIVGVMKDYHQQSLKESLLPMIHWYHDRAGFFSVKMEDTDIPGLISKVKTVYDQQFPGHAIEYHFLDDMFDQQYKADQQFGKIVGIFSALTLFITCLGLLGLTAYSISRRTKEIGIRKVMGASASDIARLLSVDFMKLVMIAICIGTPIAAYVMSLWLNGYAYRLSLQWWMFVPAAIVVMVIAILSVSFQSVKAALMNPVKSLRAE